MPSEGQASIEVCSVKARQIQSQHDTFRMLGGKSKMVIYLASEAPSRIFPQRLQVLEDLIRFWGAGIEVSMNPIINNETATPTVRDNTQGGSTESSAVNIDEFVSATNNLTHPDAESASCSIVTNGAFNMNQCFSKVKSYGETERSESYSNRSAEEKQ
ncbi:hypothetical protein JTE90_023441 [Oedothorax gibbosus]|uniref:Uncharacterized protein n=1 Tax=Oedothorax gibbosus TaxID=931172 RepID=A0AAV6U1T6_9ARAC|nr:hypothetical protein JTE90_023441 [Oedothorax gibbosus]